MIVAFDNTFLTLILRPLSIPRPDPKTGKPPPYFKERLDGLIDRLSKKGAAQVIVPSPCFAEVLCASADVEKVVDAIRAFTALEIAPFDSRSAIELAAMTRDAIAKGDKRSGVDAEWQLVKLDRQIVAIAKAHGATTLYTDDGSQSNFATLAGLSVVHSWELELPDNLRQASMFEDTP